MSIDRKRGRMVFAKLERDLVKLSSKLRPQNVHSFRTGTRRLQILLIELAPHPDRRHKKLLKSLGRIRKRAGKLRDLDVQLTALRSFKSPGEPRRKTQLINQLIELRDRQEKKLRKTLDKDTVRDLRKQLKRTAKDFSLEKARDPLSVARTILGSMNGSPIDAALLHEYRIRTKRARYAAEFANPSDKAQQFIAGIKRVQDALGDWHDWLTLTENARKHLGEVRESALVAELHNLTGAKFRQAVSALSQMQRKSAPVPASSKVESIPAAREATKPQAISAA
ncbi:MAG TPA: CHAD domain-containing protein [Candidatus Aquilonibacter sp.]|nr:CHAD domain-containing protein [Candidatus Aquilonibacter sp.]